MCTEDTFEVFENTNANGATRDSGSDTVDECKSVCLSNSDCVGFDFNTIANPNECWIHTDSNAISEENRNTGASGVNLYIRRQCGEVFNYL